MTALLSLVLFLSTTGNVLHTPHPEASDLAIARNTAGQLEMVIISRKNSKVMSSLDDGFTWNPVAGDGLGKSEAHRIVYYEVPATGEKRYVIGANEGIWQYLPDTGVVQKISTGLSPTDLYITDLAAPNPGQDGPVVAVTERGKIYFLDEATNTWMLKLDTALVDQNSVAGVAPEYDRQSLSGVDKTCMVAIRNVLVTTTDDGTTWTTHTQFDVPAVDIYDFRVSSIAFDLDYKNSGLILLGRGRRDLTDPFDSEGELYRSTDFGTTFVNVQPTGAAQISSGIYALLSAGLGPDGNQHYYASLFRYPSHEDYDAGYDVFGVLHSIDGGQTWQDHGSYQDFIQETSGNERTAVIKPYRRMLSFCSSPDFLVDGKLWYARAEGLFVSEDLGVHWGKRRFRPAQQIRGISAGFNHLGEVIAHGSTYGSGLFRYNLNTTATDTLLGEGLIYYGCLTGSPQQSEDGIIMAGGQRDLGVLFEEPNIPFLQGWYFVNAIREALDGNTGYVRTVALAPDFGGPAAQTGTRVFAWSSRHENSPLGENRMTLDGLDNVYTINGVFGQPLQRAPHMHSMDIARTFDKDVLPLELDIFGCSTSQEQVYRLLNTGSAVAPVFEWDLLDFNLTSPPVVVKADPNFTRPTSPKLWVMAEDALYELVDQSSDWSVYSINTYPGIEEYLIKDMVLGPDMDLNPTVFVITWGGGVFKIDLTATQPAWVSIGSGYPDTWGDVIYLSPNYALDSLVFVGGQDGMYYCPDQPGGQWQSVSHEVFLDCANTSFEFYSPQDPTNPDPTRQWGWKVHLREDLPPLEQADVYGLSIVYADLPEDYFLITLKINTQANIHAIIGPMIGDVHVTAWEFYSGNENTPVFDQQFDLDAPQLDNRVLAVPVPTPGVYTIRCSTLPTMPIGKIVAIDGVSATR
ncbi:MAG: hypothetical protein H8E15_12820 [Planctomycetes bacterium]|nr:hypothetical protein [Planctomycetota bacterium]